MNTNITTRPNLTVSLNPELFKNCYWDKKELVSFCSANGLSTIGGKADLVNRIEYFLHTGQKLASIKIKRIDRRDSDNKITKDTLVVNYKNDAKTRNFFEKEIGTHFRFNSYLRQFAKNSNKDSNLTYGDLIQGWIKTEEQKQNSSYKSTIDKQFEFNQFQRDFYAKEKGKNRKELVAAWQLVRSVVGPNTYEYYLIITKNLGL